MQKEAQTSNKKTVEDAPKRGGRLSWFLLLCATVVMGYYVVFDRVDQQLTEEITKRIRTRFPNHIVSVDRARLVPGESIVVDGITISQPTESGLRTVAKVGRVNCQGPIDLLGIIQGQTHIESVLVDGLELSLWPMANGRWSLESLLTGQSSSSPLPAVQVRSGFLRIGHETGTPAREIICHDLQATYTDNRNGSSDPQGNRATLRAKISSSYFSSVELHAARGLDLSGWQIQVGIQNLECSQRLIDQLPKLLRSRLLALQGFSGSVDGSVRGTWSTGGTAFQLQANLRDGRFLDARFPYPLDQIHGTIYANNSIVQLRNIEGRSGQASVVLDCDLHGFETAAPLAASVSIRNLALDEQLYKALPVSIQDQWSRFGIRGLVDAQAAIQFDGKNWAPEILIRSLDGQVNAEYFPYPVHHISGDFHYKNGIIQAPDLIAYAGDQRLRGSLTLQQAQPKWLMDLSIQADGPVPIDETLLRALTPRGLSESGFQRFANSLHPTGTVHLKRSRFIRAKENPDVVSRSLELNFSDCSIRYDGFRYPIVEINGQATLDHDRLVLRDFVGRNHAARIQGEGLATCTSSSLESMDLIFQAHQISLDEELQQALPASARNLWSQLQPSGVIDRVSVQIKREGPRFPLDLKVNISESRSSDGAGRGMSLHPVSFPYTMNDIDCLVDYRPGRIDIRSLSGVHDASRISTNGQIRLHSDGSWDGILNWLPTSRLVVDQVLIDSMPQLLRKPLAQWNFRGPVCFTGSTVVASPEEGFSSLVRDWNLKLDLEDVSLNGEMAKGIRGTIQASGENNESGTTAVGNMALDAMSIHGVAVTGTDGPFAVSGNMLYLGRDAVEWRTRNQSNRRITSVLSSHADAPVVSAAFQSRVRDGFVEKRDEVDKGWLGPKAKPNIEIPSMDLSDNDIRTRTLSGTLFLSGIEPLNGDRSRLRLRLVDSDFRGMLVDLGEAQPNVNGRLFLQCDLEGSVSNLASLSGAGRAWLRGANLYELPVMIRLLNLLSVRPDQRAFDSADVVFGIDGDRIPISKLELDGDLISMQGKGEVNFRREIHLDLATNVGRRGIIGAVVRPFTQNQNANWMRVEVTGTTTNPQIRPPMPLRDSLDQFLIESP